MAKVVVLLSPAQQAKLLKIPDSFFERDITRYYSLSAEDLAVFEQHRRPQNRLGFTVQFLERFEPLRRYATLVAYLLDMTDTLTDTALEMHDQIMGLLFKQEQKKHLAQFEQRGKAINEKVRLYADVGNALIKAKEEVADPYKTLEAVLPWETFVTSVQDPGPPRRL